MTQHTYFPCHVHSHFSLLDGLAKPTDIAKRCANLRLPGSALTDHGNIAGAIAFMSAMTSKGLKPIIGCEFYVCKERPEAKSERHLTHLCLLAKNLKGWKELVKITSEANKPENFYYKPRLDLAGIARLVNGGLIAFSGHPGSDLADVMFNDTSLAYSSNTPHNYLKATYLEDATKLALKLQDIFGKGNFFIEIQLLDHQNMPALSLLADILRQVSKGTGIPCIGTPDAHYAFREDAVDQRVLLCTSLDITMKEVRQKMVNNEQISLGNFFRSNNYCIPSYSDMVNAGHTSEELDNTLHIADMCENYSLMSSPKLPTFPCPNGMNSNEYLTQLCREGWTRRLPRIKQIIEKGEYSQDDYVARFHKEMGVLSGAGLSDYFLIVHDIVNYAMQDGQLIGAGRGSAAGSLVLYLLGVTHIDPLEFDLMFERFYNAGRNTKDHVSLPDVDMDFEIRSREKIINYIKSRFGKDRVCQMLTFTRMQGRSALKDVLRVWDACSPAEANLITNAIPDEAEIIDHLQVMREADKLAGGDGDASIIQWALENHTDDLKQWAYYDEKGVLQGPMAKQFEQAIRIEGTKRSQSKHAAGVVISAEPLNECCPMVYDKSTGEMIAGMEMSNLEEMGLIKIDCLGVALLDKIHGVINLLKTGELD